MRKVVTSVSMKELSSVISGIVSSGDDVTLCVTGYSMLPLWRDRHNNVVLTACDPSRLKKLDIPLYRRKNGQYVLHRIIKVYDDCFDLAGDAQTEIERSLPKGCVIAVVKGYYNERGKYVSCDSFRYRLYSRLWTAILPIRKYPLLFYKKTVLRLRLRNDRKKTDV